MPGLLTPEQLERVYNAWRRAMRQDPLLSRVAMPELRSLAHAFNHALTGDESGELADACTGLVRGDLDATNVVRITTFLAQTFTDEAGTESGAVTKSLVSTLGYVCGLMMTTMVADASAVARRDSLTGLENRRAWDEAIQMQLQSGPVEVAMIDLDGLKKINDTQGHEAGDAYIAKFAADLRKAVRDPVRAYRFGGDEYALLAPAGAGSALQQVLETLASTAGVPPFSYGVANSAERGGDANALLVLADGRMYEMKRRRRSSIDGAAPAENRS
jgi:diguanylate cyclase (GGDEF)-like protein